jgi:hypothetical protein
MLIRKISAQCDLKIGMLTFYLETKVEQAMAKSTKSKGKIGSSMRLVYLWSSFRPHLYSHYFLDASASVSQYPANLMFKSFPKTVSRNGDSRQIAWVQSID